ncbi:MAG: hypothetical protein KIT69_20750, partial [Propionibacteriaceae bacterium]|nr:hypothetical protein [Propionibacteriaceae bacterium]
PLATPDPCPKSTTPAPAPHHLPRRLRCPGRSREAAHVIPAKAGISLAHLGYDEGSPAYAGMTVVEHGDGSAGVARRIRT